MLKKLLTLFTVCALSLILPATKVPADVIPLHVPVLEESPEQHLFYHELLETAIEEIGHTPELTASQLPQLRIKSYLQHGLISLYWMIESEQRNQDYIPIEIGLTSKLIGKRVLFIKKGDQHLFETVENLEDFRDLNLTAHLGKKWFDVRVWQENELAYKEHSGSWKQIFRMIELGTRHNYFPRGINEILVEAAEYPNLAIEKRLVLIYDRDFRFYLSNTGINAGSRYKAVIEQALKKARESGLIKRLIKKYWGSEFEILDYDNRIKILLQTPE
ncbi:hypothetical protein [Psychromonas aquimarina]|uniref:hypothetical protein n=1 Tax=Psychromonas aquimarina TaxID=444919 RepID=UPI000426669E|nr:hypothetical protein [Psychromonas aquimarina]